MLNLLLASLSIMLASLIGVIFTWKNLGKVLEKNLHYLVSFSAGVFIIITYHLGGEAIEHASSITYGFIWIIAGLVISLILFKLLPDTYHHHHDIDDGHTHFHIDARRIIWSDALHNIGDGLLLATAFSVNTTLGITTTISIFIHEIIQEVSEFFVLRQAGYSIKRALTINFLASSTILLGAILGFFFLKMIATIETALYGIVTGLLVVVIAHDLIPHSIESIKEKSHTLRHICWFILGIVLMLALNTLLAH